MSTTSPAPSAPQRCFVPLAIFILALAGKLALYSLAPDQTPFLKYPYFAEKIGSGFAIGERLLDLSPFYLYLSVLFFKIAGPRWEVLALLQLIVGSMTCVIIATIGARLFGAAAGVLAAVMLLLYGNLTLIELTLEPEVFVLFFTSLALLVLLQAGDGGATGNRHGRWLLAGALIGLSAVTKANGLLLLPGAITWAVVTSKTPGSRATAVALLLLGTSLFILPVTVRNYLLFHDPVLITADGGKVFYHGNGPEASGMERADLDGQFALEEQAAEPDSAHALFRATARSISASPLTPSECSAFWFAAAARFIAANPLAALALEGKKFCLFWNDYEVHDIDATYRNYVKFRSWPFLTLGIIAPLGVLGMGLCLKRFRETLLLYWTVFIYLVSVLIFFAASRYRLPAVPLLALFAAWFLVDTARCCTRKEFRKAAVRLLPLPLLLAGAYLPFQHEIARYDQWQRISRLQYSLGGKKLFEQGRYREAIRELESVVAQKPDFDMPYFYLGKAYVAVGDYARAELSLARFIALSPRSGAGYRDLGILQLLQGEPGKARPYLEKAFSLNPDNALTRKYLEEVRRRAP